MRVMREGELFVLNIHDVKFHLKPINYAERMGMVQHDLIKQGKLIEESSFRILKVLQKSIKKVEGIEYSDGTPFELDFVSDDHMKSELTPQCIERLMQSEYSHEMVIAAQHISANTHWTLDMPGVKFEYAGSDKKKAVKSRASKSSKESARGATQS